MKKLSLTLVLIGVFVLIGTIGFLFATHGRSQRPLTPLQAKEAEMQFEAEQEEFYDEYPPVDLEAIKKEFEKAARAGDAEAQFQLGMAYYDGGCFDDEDWDECEKWLRKAGEQGHKEALMTLGDTFYTCCSCGWSEDELVEPLKWWSKVAEKGYPEAQFYLARLCYFSHARERHLPLAVKWFRKAAEQGHSNAQVFLVQIYRYGEGVKKDIEEAWFWCLLAAANDPELNSSYATELGKELTKEQQERVMARARKWLEEHKKE